VGLSYPTWPIPHVNKFAKPSLIVVMSVNGLHHMMVSTLLVVTTPIILHDALTDRITWFEIVPSEGQYGTSAGICSKEY